jgi:glycosyltransferase involved in cell wall biosynthesis
MTHIHRKSRRILIIAGYAPSLINFRGHLILSLQRRGHSVVCGAPGSQRELFNISQRLGCPIIPLPLSRTGLNPLSEIVLLRTLLRITRRERPDLLLAYTIKPVIYGGLATRCRSIPFAAIITGLGWGFLGGTMPRRVFTLILATMYRIAIGNAKRVFFQNPDDQAEFCGRKIASPAQARLVRGSGVDLCRFPYTPLPTGTTTFLLIARLVFDKGICEFIAAARQVRAKFPGVRFRLVGPPDPNPSAIPPQQIQAWIDEGVITWPGGVDDVRPEIAAAHVFVLPSFYREGTPRTVLEAMAMGRAIITTDAPGCRETVIHGVNGFLIPTRDSDALAIAMDRFLVDPSLIACMGKASRQLAEERFNVHRVNATIIAGLGL